MVEKPTVFKDSHDITDEFAQFGVLAIVYFSLDTRQICQRNQENVKNNSSIKKIHKNICLTHWFFDHFVIVWNFVWIHGLLKRDATSISLEIENFKLVQVQK